jgi:CIC family chloride channel protein
MFAEMITGVMLRRFTLYPMQVDRAFDSPAHESDFTIDVLTDLRVADFYSPGSAQNTVSSTMSLEEFLEHVSNTADSFFVVRGAGGDLEGIVSLSNVREVVTDSEFLKVALVTDAMWPFKSLSPEDDLRSALRTFLDSGYDHLPVVDPERPDQVLGMLSQQQIFAAYNAEILRRRLDSDDPQSDTLAG